MRVLALLTILSFSLSAQADSWSYLPELEVTEYQFGATRIERIVDARNDQTYPEFRIDVYTNDELVGRYGGQYFQDIAASNNNALFVGVSNRGLPYTAVIVFDADGNLRFLVNHNLDAERFDYCSQSITLERSWYDSQNPELRIVETDSGTRIEVRDCRGDILDIAEMLS